MVKTKRSELTSKQKQLIDYIENNWADAEFAGLERSSENYWFIFLIPDLKEEMNFFIFAHDAKDMFYKRDEEKLNIFFETIKK